MDEKPLSLREQGIQALREGDDDRAIDLLTRAVLVDSRDAEARACLGITASRKGLHVRAISALREAVSLEPENSNFHYNLGVALERAGDPREACLAFEETLRRAPDHPQARQKLAALTQASGQPPSDAPAATPMESPPPAEAVASHESSPAVESETASGASLIVDEPKPTSWEARPGLDTVPESSEAATEPAVGPATASIPPPPTFAPPPVTPSGFPTTPAWQQPPPTGYPSSAPYAGGYQPVPAYGQGYLRPHRGGMVLGLGISSIVGLLCCGLVGLPLGIAAWVTGNGDLKQMDSGTMDPSGRSQTETGRMMGIVMTVLCGLTTIGAIAYFVIVFLAAMASAGASGTP
jgi:hypothetical protein